MPTISTGNAILIAFLLSTIFLIISTTISVFYMPSCRNSCPEMHNIIYHGILSSSHVFLEWDRKTHEFQIFSLPVSTDPSSVPSIKEYLNVVESSDVTSTSPFEKSKLGMKVYKYNLLQPEYNVTIGLGQKNFLQCDNLKLRILNISSEEFEDMKASVIIPNRYNLSNAIMMVYYNDDSALTDYSHNVDVVKEVQLQQISLHTFTKMFHYPEVKANKSDTL